MCTVAKTIVFIHGMFERADCWNAWSSQFRPDGYDCLAPPWPVEPPPLRLRVADLVDHYERIVREQPSPPILVGHSLGGLVVQHLLQRGLGSCGVAISPAPSRRVLAASPTFLICCLPLLDPRSWWRPYRLPFWQFRFAFSAPLPKREQRALFDRYVVPESLSVARSIARRSSTLDYRRARSPLLLIGGGADRLVPASLVRRAAKRHSRGQSRTDYLEFERGCHMHFVDSSWRELADAVAEWLRVAAAH